MSKKMQNLVVLMEPSEDDFNVSLKGGNMIMNRFCIDEEAGFELSGVHYLEKSSNDIIQKKTRGFELKRKEKGKDHYSVLLFFCKSNSRKTKLFP